MPTSIESTSPVLVETLADIGEGPLPEIELQAKYWTAMIPYPSGTRGKGSKGIPIYDVKKNTRPDYDGFGVVIEAA